MTSWLTTKKDPQRNIFQTKTFGYMKSFYDTSIMLGINVYVVYDSLEPTLIEKYETESFKFVKMDMNHSFSTNDNRYMMYKTMLADKTLFDDNANEIYILMVDISDVFFKRNPFVAMSAHGHQELFSSSDRGTFSGNRWMRMKMYDCFRQRIIDDKKDQRQLWNAGLWGGKIKAVHDRLHAQSISYNVEQQKTRQLQYANLQFVHSRPS